MRVIEVFGAPGVGKSALFNDKWPPSAPWDGLAPPPAWRPFMHLVAGLVGHVRHDGQAAHWTRMFDKAVLKMCTLYRRPETGVYAGVGLAMRGLDLCWRGPRLDEVAEYFRLMPLPAGAVSLFADQETIRTRNIERGKRQPSRELSRLAHLNEAPRIMVRDILRERGVAVLELDTRDDVDANRSRIDAFARDVGCAAIAGVPR